MDKDNINANIARNIAYYRKKRKLTQAELAEFLNYSDKSVSKWEREDGLPSILVLKEISDFFGITINDLISDKVVKPKNNYKHRLLITYLYASIVLLIGGVVYGTLSIVGVDYENWHIIIYSLPVFFLTLMIFTIVWKWVLQIFIYYTLFIWTMALSLFIGFNIENGYWFFIIAIPIYFFFLYLISVLFMKNRT
ncbi:MAG: helix-turn-helix transcriptional regulator [Acholeplasma sp.]|nr:helix-turn-helix transcriptional regulator [Acholeplasma sp.]